MTLIIAMANDSVAAMVTDRRISQGGHVVSDEYNKATVLFCADARLAVAFTGFAYHNGFNTSEWLAETLFEIGESTQEINEILPELCSRAGQKFATLPDTDRRLTIVLCGFVYWGEVPEPRIYTVSNFEDGNQDPTIFKIRTAGASGDILVEVAGNDVPLNIKTIDSLRWLLTKPTPPASLVRFAVKNIQNASREDRALNGIGEQCTAILIKSKIDTAITNTYHTVRDANRAYGANVVVASALVSISSEIMSHGILAGKDIRKKDKCWCGSGLLFKHCHLRKYGQVYLRHRYWKRPLFAVVQVIRDVAQPSGRVCLVTSGYE